MDEAPVAYATQSAAIVTEPAIFFTFTGNHRDMLSREGLKMVLQYVSILGIPWGWVTSLRWVARNISFSDGTKATFVGTASQAWGFAVLLFFVGIMNRLSLRFTDTEHFHGAPFVLVIAALIWCVTLGGLTVYVQREFVRWRIEKTSLSSGDTPSFLGTCWAIVGWNFLIGISIVSIIGWAWVAAAYYRWVCRNTSIATHRGEFLGSGAQVLWRTVVAVLGCIPILTIPAVTCWWGRWFFSQIKGVPEAAVYDTYGSAKNSFKFAVPILMVPVLLSGWGAITWKTLTPAEQRSLSAGSEEASTGPVRVDGAVQAPKKLVDVDPIYPPAAQSASVQGVVVLEATIGVDGRVEGVKVLQSVPLLDEAAMEAVKQWKYTPTVLEGVPVPVIMKVTVNFTMR